MRSRLIQNNPKKAQEQVLNPYAVESPEIANHLVHQNGKNLEGLHTFVPHHSLTLMIKKTSDPALRKQKKEQAFINFAKMPEELKSLHKSFQKIKSHLYENPDDIDKLKPETKEKISAIIKIEQSVKYRLSRHFMNRLDIFSRFFFPIVWLTWLNITMFMLDGDAARFVLLGALILSILVCYCYLKIYDKSKLYNISKWQAIKWYMRCG